jgi:hypothetical protein
MVISNDCLSGFYFLKRRIKRAGRALNCKKCQTLQGDLLSSPGAHNCRNQAMTLIQKVADFRVNECNGDVTSIEKIAYHSLRLGVTSWLSMIHPLSVAWLEGGQLFNGNVRLF